MIRHECERSKVHGSTYQTWTPNLYTLESSQKLLHTWFVWGSLSAGEDEEKLWLWLLNKWDPLAFSFWLGAHCNSHPAVRHETRVDKNKKNAWSSFRYFAVTVLIRLSTLQATRKKDTLGDYYYGFPSTSSKPGFAYCCMGYCVSSWIGFPWCSLLAQKERATWQFLQDKRWNRGIIFDISCSMDFNLIKMW